jgi:hypothetical protein
VIARALMAAGAVFAAVAVFAEPPFTAAWVPGVGFCVAGWWRQQGEPARAAERRRAGRRGWLHG